MKNPRFERLGRLQQEYHRHHPWELSPSGLHVTTCYRERDPEGLSWWDDVGFVLNRRRVIVHWEHPRELYRDEIQRRASELVGEFPDSSRIDRTTPIYRQVGRSRKVIVAYRSEGVSPQLSAHWQRLTEQIERLAAEGIDFEVRPSVLRRRYSWATGLELVAPIEVRNEEELAVVADLGRRLLRGETTLAEAFPDYCYGKADWLAEADKRKGALG